MFGPIMEFRTRENALVRMAPLTRELMPQFVTDGGMQSLSVLRFMGRTTAPTVEDEYDWYDKLRQETDTLVWGIFIQEDETWKLIGSTSLADCQDVIYPTMVSGSVIFRPEYWGRGIAGACHRARTWYAFTHRGAICLRSAVMLPNEASYRALHRVGYEEVSRERNAFFRAGQAVTKRNLECVNPAPWAWRLWWHGERVPAAFRRARQRTEAVMTWAETEVKLP